MAILRCTEIKVDDHLLPYLYQSLTAEGAKLLVTLTADLSSIPTKQMLKRTGADEQTYFNCGFEIKVTFHSAHMTYSL
jgi:hypothetical protein